MAKEANMAAVERIKAAREKSLKIMNMGKSLDKIAEGKRGTIYSNISVDDGADARQIVAESNPVSMPTMMPQTQNVTQTTMQNGRWMGGKGAENVPSIIRESFQNNPIADDSTLLMQTLNGTQDLGGLLGGNVAQPIQQQMVTETVHQQPQQQPVQYSSGIDYPMIRTIVEEIVRKYATSLNKKIINEGKENNNLSVLTIGKDFKFMDSKGNIYEAKLTKVGNINDKKKGVNE